MKLGRGTKSDQLNQAPCRGRGIPWWAWLAFAAALPASVGAQRAPDAGQLQQEMDRQLRDRPAMPRVQGPAASSGAQQSASPAAGAGPTVTLRRVAFSGNPPLSPAELERSVASFLGRPLGFADLQRLAATVAQRCREAGRVVRTALPPQDLGDGVLTVEVIEARFGAVRIEHQADGGPPRIDSPRLVRAVEAELKPDAPVHTRALDRALKRLEDSPGLRITGSLAPGDREGTTDLVLQTLNRPPVEGTYGIDNQGSRSTGSLRALASIHVASPTGAADRLSTQAMVTEGNRFLRAAYQRPWGDRGWMTGLSASALAYRLTDPALAPLEAQGESRTLGLDLSYPWIRQTDATLTLSALADTKRLINRAVGTTVSDYRIDSLQLAASGHRLDESAGLRGGVTVVSVAATAGRAVLDGSPHEASDLQGARVAGAFFKLRGTLTRQQQLTDRLSVSFSAGGQVANRNLDSAERFQIGGSSGVRAYSASEGGGRSGYLMTVETAWALMPKLNLTAFLDRGSVLGDRPMGTWTAPGPTRITLQGAGLGAAWSPGSGLSSRVIWARRIGRNPNPTVTGNDQDGALTINRFWIEMGGAF